VENEILRSLLAGREGKGIEESKIEKRDRGGKW
jgi:hypothetical protein